MDYKLYNINGSESSKKFKLNKEVYGIKPNEHCIYLVVKSELAAHRQGTSSSKTRSEVRGGGAKPWKQKGTGRARVGSTRNPSRVHGGAAFGPKPHKYEVKVNKKVKLLAKKSALSLKVSSSSYKIIEEFVLKTHKTKDFISMLNKFDLNNEKITLITGNMDNNNNLYLSSKNLEKINLVRVDSFSTYDVMNCNYLLLDKSGIEYINENFGK